MQTITLILAAAKWAPSKFIDLACAELLVIALVAALVATALTRHANRTGPR